MRPFGSHMSCVERRNNQIRDTFSWVHKGEILFVLAPSALIRFETVSELGGGKGLCIGDQESTLETTRAADDGTTSIYTPQNWSELARTGGGKLLLIQVCESRIYDSFLGSSQFVPAVGHAGAAQKRPKS